MEKISTSETINTTEVTQPHGIIHDHFPATDTMKSAQETSGSKIHHNTLEATAFEDKYVASDETTNTRRVTIQLSDFGVPSMTHDLNRPHERISCRDEDCLTFLKEVTEGRISKRLIETDAEGAAAIVTQLENVRTALRKRFAAYAEIPVHDVVGTLADDLERKLFARHFRNKEAQHRVFMIGFSVALVCIVGGILTDTFGETNQKLTEIAEVIGVATTLLGISGHLLMRFSDARNEKRQVRSIQELALLDNVIEKFRIALH